MGLRQANAEPAGVEELYSELAFDRGATPGLRELLRIPKALPRAFGAAASSIGRPPIESVPCVRPSPFQVAALMLDELAMGAMHRTVMPTPTPGSVSHVRDTSARAVAELTRAGLLDDPGALFPAPPLPSDIRRTRRRFRGFTFGHFSWPSGFVPPASLPGHEEWMAVAENRTAHYYAFRHQDRGRPWVLVLHPYMAGDARDLFVLGSLALHIVLGVNIIHPVMAMHGPRGRSSSIRYPGADPVRNLLGAMQTVWDVRTVIALAKARGAPTIGVHGYSLGGQATALLAGVEPNLDCVVAGAPGVDYLRLVAELDAGHGLDEQQLDLVQALTTDESAVLAKLASPLSYEPLLPKARRYIYAPVGDRMVLPHHARDLWRHWEEPTIAWVDGSHLTAFASPAARAFIVNAFRRSGVKA